MGIRGLYKRAINRGGEGGGSTFYTVCGTNPFQHASLEQVGVIEWEGSSICLTNACLTDLT